MTPLFAKLNLKDHREILVLDAPPEFEKEIARLEGVIVHRAAARLPRVSYALVFVKTRAAIQAAAAAILPKAPGDPVLWFAYPKRSSKRHACDFDRDTGWAALGEHGLEGVRQVAIDEDWSALRFRRCEHIRTLARDPSRALSPAGRARTQAPRSGPARSSVKD